MATKTLPAGPLKIIVGNIKTAERNRNRSQATLTAQSKLDAEARASRTVPEQARPFSARPVYGIIVLNDAGEVEATYAANLDAVSATLCTAQHGLAKLRPAVAAALRPISEDRVWFWTETRDELTLLDLAE